MYSKIPNVVKQSAWNGPFIVVECTLSACADVQAHSCMHCQDSVGTCVCVCMCCLCVRKNAWRPLPASLGRTESEGRHTLVGWRVATAHLVMPVWKRQLQVAGFAAIHFTSCGEGGKKRIFFSSFFSFSPPVSITGRRPKQSNYKLNTHLSLAALHNSVGEAGWKEFFVCLFVSLFRLNLCVLFLFLFIS